MHSLLHDIPRIWILFLEELFLIFNQMLSIQAFGRRVILYLWDIHWYPEYVYLFPDCGNPDLILYL